MRSRVSWLTSLFLSTPPSPPGIYALSLHDALPISRARQQGHSRQRDLPRFHRNADPRLDSRKGPEGDGGKGADRSEEDTSELQSRGHLVCRLLLEKKKSMYRKDI